MTSLPFAYYRIPLILLATVIAVCIATVWSPPAGRVSWLLEVGPGLAGIAVLIGLYRRFPMSHMAYWCVFLHIFILHSITQHRGKQANILFNMLGIFLNL